MRWSSARGRKSEKSERASEREREREKVGGRKVKDGTQTNEKEGKKTDEELKLDGPKGVIVRVVVSVLFILLLYFFSVCGRGGRRGVVCWGRKAFNF